MPRKKSEPTPPTESKEVESKIETTKTTLSQSYIMLGGIMTSFIIVMVLGIIQFFNSKNLEKSINKVSSETSNIETIQYNLIDRMDSIEQKTSLISQENHKIDSVLNKIQKSLEINTKLIKNLDKKIVLIPQEID